MQENVIVKASISKQIAEQLRAAIVAGQFILGQRLPTGGNFVVQPSYAELAESLSGAATLLVGMGALGIEEIIEARRTLQGSMDKLLDYLLQKFAQASAGKA